MNVVQDEVEKSVFGWNYTKTEKFSGTDWKLWKAIGQSGLTPHDWMNVVSTNMDDLLQILDEREKRVVIHTFSIKLRLGLS